MTAVETQILAEHPDGAVLVAYRGGGESLRAAFYTDGDFVRPHPDGGFGVSPARDGHLRRLTPTEVRVLVELADMYGRAGGELPILESQAALVAAGLAADDGHRLVRLVPASQIRVRPVRWLWEGRVALGTLALVAGREGLGKSTLVAQQAADITRGRMPGRCFEQPRAVIVAATEDSRERRPLCRPPLPSPGSTGSGRSSP